MKTSGSQLQQITALLESGAIGPVVDKVFSFESTNEALAYVKSGQTNDKVVIKIRRAIAPCIWI
jgi:NADPH:quinone reductase-like Zn-dependent oxidoreductase